MGDNKIGTVSAKQCDPGHEGSGKNYYEDKKRLTRKRQRQGSNHEDEYEGSRHSDDLFSLIGDSEHEFNNIEASLSCGTKKSRDKRICHYNVGIFLAAFPCEFFPFRMSCFIVNQYLKCSGLCRIHGPNSRKGKDGNH